MQGYVPYPPFPAWFGKHSRMSKHKRLIAELRAVLMGHSNCNDMDLIHCYVPLLLDNVISRMDEPEEVLKVLEEYGLTMDQVKEHLMELEFDGAGKLKFERLQAPVKTKVTRLFNQKHGQNFKMKKKKQTLSEGDGMTDDEMSEDEEEEEEIEVKKAVGKKTKKETKGKKTTTAAAKSKGAKKAAKKDSFIDDEEYDWSEEEEYGGRKGRGKSGGRKK